MGSPKGAKFNGRCTRCGRKSINELCHHCRLTTMVVVPCASPGCTSTRIVSMEYAKRNPEVKRCKSCAKKAWLETLRVNYEEKKAKQEGRGPSNTISLNGCTLVRTAKGRCADYSHCRTGAHANLYDVPRAQDCCWRIARLVWPGWKCTVANPDIVPASEESEMMRTERLSCQALALDA